MPQATRLTLHILAAVAEHEREAISQRTKVALAAAKGRGTRLGSPDATKARGLAAVKLHANAARFAAAVLPTIDCQNADGLGLTGHCPRTGPPRDQDRARGRLGRSDLSGDAVAA